MSDKKLLFFDIDGTLAWPGEKVSPATVEALRMAQKNGHKIFLSTGRGQRFLGKEIESIAFDGGIYHVGALAIVNGKKVFDACVPTELWRHTAELINDEVMSWSIDCDTVAYNNRQYSMDYLREQYDLPDGVLYIVTQQMNKLMTAYQGESVYKMICLCDGTEHMNTVRELLQGIATVTSYEKFTGDASLAHADICFGTFSKATGMQAICEELGMTAGDCIAFGDGTNDMELIDAAGIGVAMGNAEPELKAVADRVCEHCLEDGIAKELKRLGII